MNRDLPVPRGNSSELQRLPEALIAKMEALARASKAPATVRSYLTTWNRFQRWCDQRGLVAMPASGTTVAAFASDLDDFAVSTISKMVAGISEIHRLSDEPSPSDTREVRLVMQGLRRTRGCAPRQKKPLRVRQLKRICAVLPDDLLGHRDRALLLLGFAAALRRSELVALEVVDLEEMEEGLLVKIRRSKTDQTSAGAVVGVPFGSSLATCPVRAVRRWLAEAGVTEGPLLRPLGQQQKVGVGPMSGRTACRAVQRCVKRIGLDPTHFGSHSLRAGLVTEAASKGFGQLAISRQTRHKSLSALAGYVRLGAVFEANVVAELGL